MITPDKVALVQVLLPASRRKVEWPRERRVRQLRGVVEKASGCAALGRTCAAKDAGFSVIRYAAGLSEKQPQRDRDQATRRRRQEKADRSRGSCADQRVEAPPVRVASLPVGRSRWWPCGGGISRSRTTSAEFTRAFIWSAKWVSGANLKSCLEEMMTITGIISAILVGLVIGALGRLVVPGKQHIPIWLTILVGIGAAFLGTALARAVGIPTATQGIDWLELLVQVVVAAIGVGIVAAAFGRRRSKILRR